MKNPPAAPAPPPAPAAVGKSLAKRLARFRKRIFRILSGIESVREPSPRELRRAGDLAAAERACARAIALHPDDLPLAIEHAEIARASKDFPARMTRWQRVLDLGGDRAPVGAFSDLAECHLHRHDPAAAEVVLRKGLAIHPAALTLQTKLAGVLLARGFTADAIATWHAAIAAHPDKNLAPVYLHLGHALRDEGLLVRAETVLRQGMAKYPGDVPLRDSLATLAYTLADRSREPLPCESVTPSTAHLFEDRVRPFAQGTVAFSTANNALRQHVPAMLDFAETLPVPEQPGDPGTVDVFAIWGAPTDGHRPVRETAAAAGRPLLCLDSGFLSSPGIEGREAAVHSIVVTPDSVYYDATRPSHLENTLNSDDFALTEEQRLRAEANMTSIVANRLSKFNHAPRIDLRPRFPADGTRRILLIDQRQGSPSLHWSLGGPATFERMWEDALALPDCQILVKIHPESIAGRARSLLAPLMPFPLPGNVVVIDFDVNPHDLLDVVDEVFVATSQLGFEAVLAGKEVHCYAAPYYAGWGFTRDRGVVPRRRLRRTPAEVFHLYHIVHSRYFAPATGLIEIEDLVRHLVAVRDSPSPPVPTLAATPAPLRILMVLPSGRYGATGRYLQNLSVALVGAGCEVMILVKGPCRPRDAGVRWRTFAFDGLRLTEAIRREIVGFAPHFIYENGVRAVSQRIALEAVALTGARFAMQSMDDDVQIQLQREGEKAAHDLVALDRPYLTTAEIARYLGENDWNTSLRVFLDPGFNYWIEPLLRVVCYRLASFHTAIWHPYAERLAREYDVPTLVVPPVARAADFQRIPMTPVERAGVLTRYSIDPAATVIFIGGALYPYSGEFAVFLTALDLAAREPGANYALVVTSGRSSLPLARMAAARLGSTVSFTDIGVAADAVYMEMLKACDVVCSPGLPDHFSRYRLPSRLVKAMAMGKPILICRCGFGESLEHGHNAFLMDGEDPAAWASSIALCQRQSHRTQVGLRGRDFATGHFDATRVAMALKRQFELTLREAPRALTAGIGLSAEPDTHTRQKIPLRSRYHSPRQPAIHALALRTHRLDTVVHIGAGDCDELEDYCRLGARQIALPDGEPAEALGSLATAPVLPPDSEGSGHLLSLEGDTQRADVFQNVPSLVIERFRWIVSAGNDGVVKTLEAAGFRVIPLPLDHSGMIGHFLFERTQPTSDPTS